MRNFTEDYPTQNILQVSSEKITVSLIRKGSVGSQFHQRHISSSRHIKRSMRISRTALSDQAGIEAPVRLKLALKTGLKEGVHILRALHNDGLLVVIRQDEEALLLYRLDDDLPDLVGRHQHAMENG